MEVFTDEHYQKYCNFINNSFGINMGETKKEILESKLKKLMAKNGINSYDSYFKVLINNTNREAIRNFINEITVNKTDFFRENNHFEFIRNKIDWITENNKRINRNREIRAWSAGCSSGEEAYTLAMVLHESFPQHNIKILATDINTEVLEKAITGRYSSNIKNDVETKYLSKYFVKTDSGLAVKDSLKEMVVFRQFNLNNRFPIKNGFDVIFCRNVMIYFDYQMQRKILDKFYNVLVPGGLLFIGHSEGISNMRLDYKYIQPAVYLK